MKFIADYFGRRKAAREQDSRVAGWDWAAGELLRGTPAQKVLDTLCGRVFHETSSTSAAFDQGAEAAVRAWNNMLRRTA